MSTQQIPLTGECGAAKHHLGQFRGVGTSCPALEQPFARRAAPNPASRFLLHSARIRPRTNSVTNLLMFQQASLNFAHTLQSFSIWKWKLLFPQTIC